MSEVSNICLFKNENSRLGLSGPHHPFQVPAQETRLPPPALWMSRHCVLAALPCDASGWGAEEQLAGLQVIL